MNTLNQQQKRAIIFEAMRLLLDQELEWGNDFESIRPALCRLFMNAMSNPDNNRDVLNLAMKIIEADI